MLHERFHKYLACNLCSRRERAHTRSSLPVKQLFTERKGEERASERVKPAGKRRAVPRAALPPSPAASRQHQSRAWRRMLRPFPFWKAELWGREELLLEGEVAI